MAVEVHVANEPNNVVAVRFFGGRVRGTVVQMEVTEREFHDWQNVMVQEETSDEVMSFSAWVERQREAGVSVVWDNAVRHNVQARAFEQNPFFDTVPVLAVAAAEHRRRANVVRRESFSVVS